MKLTLFLFALVALPALSLAQESTVFKVTPPAPVAGESHSWLIDVKFEAVGQEARFTGTLKRKILKIDENGDVTWETQMTDGKVVIGGSEMEQPSEPSTTIVDKNGKLKSEKKETQNDLEEILTAFAAVKPPAEGIAKDKVFQVDAGGRFKGKSECKVTGIESNQGRDCLKLEVSYTAASGEGTGTGIVYLDKESGILVGYDAKLVKVSVAAGIVSDGTASMKLLDVKKS